MPMSLGESGRGTSGRKGRTPATPWRKILGHPAVWAILVNNFTFHYAFYVVMNWLPTYFDKVGSQPVQEQVLRLIKIPRFPLHGVAPQIIKLVFLLFSGEEY